MARKRISTEIANRFDQIIDRLTHVDISYSNVDEAIEKTRAFLERAGVLDGEERVEQIIADKAFIKKRAAQVRKEAGQLSATVKRDPSIVGMEGFPMQGSKREVVDFFRIAIGDAVCDELVQTPQDGIYERVKGVLAERNPEHIDQDRYLKQFGVKFDRVHVKEVDEKIAEIKRTR